MAYSDWLGFAAVWLLGLITGLLIAWGVFQRSNSSQSGSQKVTDMDAIPLPPSAPSSMTLEEAVKDMVKRFGRSKSGEC